MQPDFWPDHDEISNNDAGGVAFNFVWQQWEPEVKLAPCSDSEMEYDDHCFIVPAIYDENIADWTSRGLTVTAVIYGVPAWARQEPCSPAAPGFEIFCAPKNPEDYARFVGMIARRYDGNHDVGRVPDFVIHNEVNSNTWYDIGCGQGLGACDTSEWLDSYADNWNAAYDRVQVEQPYAKVFISLEHHFDEQYDQPDADSPLLSVRTFLSGFASRVGDRTWRVAFHPYPPDLFSAEFSADDLASEGKVTYGSVGGLQGWIYQKFGDIEAARDVHFTESGVNSSPPSTEAAQEVALCDSFRNILGTPGVHNHIYHRMSDNKNEGGLNLGLRRTDTSAKPAWSTWALMNQDDSLDCGFEELPYTRLTRSFSQSRGHWASSRLAPTGFKAESSYRLLRAPEDGTHLLFECAIGQHNMLTKDPGCEGQLPLGPVGYAWDAAGPNLVELFRCLAGSDHFISTDPGCEGQKVETSLGWVHT
ncbi:MAG TPA: hypothetical protein ENJ18_14675 [Nannocystis exedens]|nr:hypothetical protein [Nannocystis exedens]